MPDGTEHRQIVEMIPISVAVGKRDAEVSGNPREHIGFGQAAQMCTFDATCISAVRATEFCCIDSNCATDAPAQCSRERSQGSADKKDSVPLFKMVSESI